MVVNCAREPLDIFVPAGAMAEAPLPEKHLPNQKRRSLDDRIQALACVLRRSKDAGQHGCAAARLQQELRRLPAEGERRRRVEGDDPPGVLAHAGRQPARIAGGGWGGGGTRAGHGSARRRMHHLEGSDGVRTLTSADLRYRVAANSGTEDGTEPEPGTPAWQAFVDAVKESAASAEQSKTEALDAAERAITSADEAAASAASALVSAESAEKNALSSATSAAEATRQAELAAQAAENKGFLYLEDDDNSGILSLVVSDNLTDDVTLQDDGQGNLEVVYK